MFSFWGVGQGLFWFLCLGHGQTMGQFYKANSDWRGVVLVSLGLSILDKQQPLSSCGLLGGVGDILGRMRER